MAPVERPTQWSSYLLQLNDGPQFESKQRRALFSPTDAKKVDESQLSFFPILGSSCLKGLRTRSSQNMPSLEIDQVRTIRNFKFNIRLMIILKRFQTERIFSQSLHWIDLIEDT